MSAVLVAGLVTLGAPTAPATASVAHAPVGDVDRRVGSVAPTAAQEAVVRDLGATVRWNRFGTPRSLTRHDGVLASGVRGADAEAAARAWLTAQGDLFRLSDHALDTMAASRLGDSPGWVVTLAQRFGELKAVEDGLVTVGLRQAGGTWDVVHASSTLTGDRALAAQPSVGARQAWLTAAQDVGRTVRATDVVSVTTDDDWHVLTVEGFSGPQRTRLVALPTPQDGVRPAWETFVVDDQGGHATGFAHYVDAATGEVVVRRDIVHQSHDAAETFSGSMPPGNGACAPDFGPYTVAADEPRVGSVVVAVEATLTVNDSVIELRRDGEVVASQDTGTSPEALVYDPPDEGRGAYSVRVCDFDGGAGWAAPTSFAGQVAFTPVDAQAGFPYPPKWKVFPAYPQLEGSQDIRELWCWQSEVSGQEIAECEREVMNGASRAPWDWSVRANAPTFTTSGNNAHTAEAWTSPLTPGATGFRPVSPRRDYSFDWKDEWRTSGCFTPFVPGRSHDIAAATTNLFAMHNRMHDWAYELGFTERHWNAQDSNFGSGGTADGDALLGDAQAGAATGGFPTYLGRDNANMIPLPDGVPPITNMYLWQPIAGAFYAPCVDGDYDMAVIAHEYGHLIENRMIGKGNRRSGHHAGAMGESSGDLLGVEYLNEDGLVPVGDENRFALGAYVTGNGQRGIRNYGMNASPLNFSDIGYDFTGPQVHADGEIWSATNFDIRQALVKKYDAAFPESDKALQRACASGERPADRCPGNRRWMQIMFDAYLLMPTAPSMLDARDAYLAADKMRFGGADQAELWNAFAGRGFGEGAWSTNSAAESPTDPRPDFSSPHAAEADVTFKVVSSGDRISDQQPVKAQVYVGRYEARVSPVADTDPATSAPPQPGAVDNLDASASFVPGTYEFVVRADGYGLVRLTRTLAAGTRTLTVQMLRNHASGTSGATASGDGEEHAALIDDTEATNWDRTGARVEGSQVTVDLAGDKPVTVGRVNVSAMLVPVLVRDPVSGDRLVPQNRFTALRKFAIETSTDGTTFERIYTSPDDAFPGAKPRPVAPELIARSFDVPDRKATHVRLVVLANQCTGNQEFQGSQDNDPLNGTDCQKGSPGAGPVTVFGDLPQVVAPRDTEVHVAELQVFAR